MPQNNSIGEIQDSFKTLMLDHPDALNTPPTTIEENFIGNDGTLPARLKIYRNNIIGSLTDVMRATFPTIEKLVGEAFFEQTARSFILHNPPENGCLMLFGQGFDEFLKTFEPVQHLEYLPDIAKLELALNKAYYASDDNSFALHDLAQIDPEALNDLKLPLRDSVELIASNHQISKIREFAISGNDENAPEINGDEYLLVFRPQLQTEILELNPDEFFILTQFKDGKTLGESVLETLEKHPEFDIQAFLQKFISLETFSMQDTNR